ncbi:heat shock protein 70 [Serendipita vermifera]|nr:heat shock protein 70 [Serendipita vermifera]
MATIRPNKFKPMRDKKKKRARVYLLFSFVLFILALVVFLPISVGAKSAQHPDVIIGIDLGTTYSAVGVQRPDGRVEIITNDQGNRITPSWVSYTGTERLVGDSAKHSFALNPKNTVFDVKRLIGRRMDDTGLQKELKHLTYDVFDRAGKPTIGVQYREERIELSPEEISAAVLTKMKETAEAFLGHPVTKAVVTVPAYFNDAQRSATKDAGTIAGLEIVRVLNEPTAAALAHGFREVHGEKTILVYDLGGGTFDVSLLSVEDGVFEVLATAGDTRLGGEDFDHSVMDHLVRTHKHKIGRDLTHNDRAMSRLKREVERAKRALSSQSSARIELDALDDGRDFSYTISRAKFEELNMDLFKKTMNTVERVLKDAKVDKSQVDEVILVGGSTRIPKVQAMVKEYFNKEPNRSINPDEAVAYGAAIQGGILSGTVPDMVGLVIDAIPLSLGIETTGGVFSELIHRHSTIPTKKTQIFSTVVDNQDTVQIRVFEGEASIVKGNNFLGSFDLSGIPPAPRGVPQIEVAFEVDANGILVVSAMDKAANTQNGVTITQNGRLPPEEIARMMKVAKEFAEQAHSAEKEAENGEEHIYDPQVQHGEKDEWLNRMDERDKSGKDLVNETKGDQHLIVVETDDHRNASEDKFESRRNHGPKTSHGGPHQEP